MKHTTYLIIGGGLAADGAVKGIREIDKDGSICLISGEGVGPYIRPNLSKKLWKGKDVKKIWCNTEEQGVDMVLNRVVITLDPNQKRAVDNQGDVYTYDKLLLATGGNPIHLPFGKDLITYFRTFADYQHLRDLTESGSAFLVIGGGFIGAEIAASLKGIGKDVIMAFPEETLGSRVYPKDLGLFLNDYYRNQGVEIYTGDTIEDVQQDAQKILAFSKSGKRFSIDGVVAGIGIRPNIALAQESGLTVSNGIDVNEYLQSSISDIYAAGDVANFYHHLLGKRVRVEHEDNAVSMGHTAGRNMAGASEAYEYAPMFYSDLFDLGYEAVGELDSRLETFSDWTEPFKKGVIYYLEDNYIKGVLLWNVWDTVDKARALIAEKKQYSKDELAGLL